MYCPRKGITINSFILNTTGYAVFMVGCRVTYHWLQYGHAHERLWTAGL